MIQNTVLWGIRAGFRTFS